MPARVAPSSRRASRSCSWTSARRTPRPAWPRRRRPLPGSPTSSRSSRTAAPAGDPCASALTPARGWAQRGPP
eukprot:4962948-Lingulodinium_polyedra.AAC.1